MAIDETKAALEAARAKIDKYSQTLLDLHTKYQAKLDKIHDDYKTGKSDDWLHARRAYDLLAQLMFDIATLNKELRS